MRNSLELEIVKKITEGNKQFGLHRFTNALKKYEQSLEIYSENKLINDTVNPHFEPMVLSLISVTHYTLGNLSSAEQAIEKSLRLSPFDSLSLIRRARIYTSLNRLEEALDDIQMVNMSRPEERNRFKEIEEIQKKVSTIHDDLERREFLSKRLVALKGDLEEIEDCCQEDLLINFSKLKKIERSSFSHNRKNHIKKKLSTFSEDNGSMSYSQLIQSDEIEESQENYNSSELSEKSVRFSKNLESEIKINDYPKIEEKKKNLLNTRRKSSLKRTYSGFAPHKENENLFISSFMNLRNIDGKPIIHEEEVLKELLVVSNSDKVDSDSDNEGKEHNIFGRNQRNSRIINRIQSLQKEESNQKYLGSSNRGSILKKSSLVASSSSSKKSSKKNVSFTHHQRHWIQI